MCLVLGSLPSNVPLLTTGCSTLTFILLPRFSRWNNHQHRIHTSRPCSSSAFRSRCHFVRHCSWLDVWRSSRELAVWCSLRSSRAGRLWTLNVSLTPGHLPFEKLTVSSAMTYLVADMACTCELFRIFVTSTISARAYSIPSPNPLLDGYAALHSLASLVSGCCWLLILGTPLRFEIISFRLLFHPYLAHTLKHTLGFVHNLRELHGVFRVSPIIVWCEYSGPGIDHNLPIFRGPLLIIYHHPPP